MRVLPIILDEMDQSSRSEFARELAAASSELLPIREDLLKTSAALDDPQVLIELVLTDGLPNLFWDFGAVTACASKVAKLGDQSVWNQRISAVQGLLEAAARSGSNVSENVFELLANDQITDPDSLLKWIARSEVLSPGGILMAGIEPIRERAHSRIIPNGTLTQLDYVALLARLHPYADASSAANIDSELSSWVSTSPLDPDGELGAWFPGLPPLSLGLASLLLNRPAPDLDDGELRQRIDFALSQSVSWEEIIAEVTDLLSGGRTGRSLDLIRLSIECNAGSVPVAFFPDLYERVLNQFHNGSAYRPDLLPLLWQMVEADPASPPRRKFRKTLIAAMTSGTSRAIQDYRGLGFTISEVHEDVSAALADVKARTISSVSGPLLEFIANRPPQALRSEIINELGILATDSKYWEIGLDALLSVDWPPGTRIAARLCRTIATDSELLRESNPPRALKALRTALHLRSYSNDRDLKSQLRQAIDALQRSAVITEEQGLAFKVTLE